MTHRLLARRWRSFALAAVLLVLAGAILLVWLRIDSADTRAAAQDTRAAALATEANRRGDAVSTLAGDVRTLRSQLQADGKTPSAPDPAQAVRDLPGRVEVPVPIPGPPGPPGPAGKAAPIVTPSPGPPGRSGADSTVPGPAGPPGADSTVPGPAGPAGPAGADSTVPGPQGERGEQGPAGPSCPDGYSLQPPASDPDALVCRRDGAPDPSPSQGPGIPLALEPNRRQYP